MESVNNMENLKKLKTKRALIHRIIQRQQKFLEYVLRKEGLLNLIHTEHTERKVIDEGREIFS